MLLKIRYWKKSEKEQFVVGDKLIRDLFYSCTRASIHYGEKYSSLYIDVGERGERIVPLLCDKDCTLIEVYFMNSDGKTIDRYNFTE